MFEHFKAKLNITSRHTSSRHTSIKLVSQNRTVTLDTHFMVVLCHLAINYANENRPINQEQNWLKSFCATSCYFIMVHITNNAQSHWWQYVDPFRHINYFTRWTLLPRHHCQYNNYIVRVCYKDTWSEPEWFQLIGEWVSLYWWWYWW